MDPKFLEGKTKLRGGFTRNITLTEINGTPVVVKNYPGNIKPFFIDVSKSTFSLFYLKPRISLLSKQDRILREIIGHGKLEEAGISVPKIVEFSFDDSFIAEEYVPGANLYSLMGGMAKDEVKHFSEQVGEITGKLHSMGYAFFDNRPANYMVKDGNLVRVDLETFEMEPSPFERYCDVVSFIESFGGETRKDVHDSFIEGYEKYARHEHNKLLEGLARRALMFLNMNRPRFRIGSPSDKDSVGPDSHTSSS